MKALLPILLLITTATQSLLAQTTTLTFPYISGTNPPPDRQQDIPVLAGEVFELLTWGPAYNGPGFLKVDGIPVTVSVAPGSTGLVVPVLSPTFAIAGPRTVSFVIRSNESLVCTYKVTAVATVSTVNVASQAVVIPENASAPVDIIFESSTDLTNWTAAVAGSYAPSTSKRFFRVRLVTH